MVTGTGKPVVCLDNISDGATSPESPLMDLEGPNQVQTSSRPCVFLTVDLQDCMAFCERCSWIISQGKCIRPGARANRYRDPQGARCV